MRLFTILAGTALLSTVVSCGGDGLGPNGPPPPPPPPVITTVEIAPNGVTVPRGDTTRLAATVKDQRGQAMTGKVVEWTSSATTVATVTTDGLVSAVAAGAATITASIEGKSATAQVTVVVPVATVAVAPAAAKLVPGGRIRLVATPKAAAGDSVRGKTIVWTTSDITVATVSAAGLVEAVGTGQAAITATVDGKFGVTAITVIAAADNVQTEPARAVSDTIGVLGGELRATSASGVKYVLTVPAGALRSVTRITVTPVATIQTAPFQTVAGAVDFQPAGLVFAKPAALVIEAPLPTGDSLRLVGFSADGTAQRVVPAVATLSNNRIRVAVPHFSVGGAGFTTVGGMLSFLSSGGPTNASQTYIDQLLALGQDAINNIPALFDVMRQWMANVIVPKLQNATTDIQLFLAVAEYNWWVSTDVGGLVKGTATILQPDRDAATQAALPRIKQMIAGNNAQCLADRDIDFAAGALYWQTVAEDLGLATTANQLDRPTVIDQLCIQVVLTQVSFPTTVSAGNGATLDVAAGLKFGIDPQIMSARFSWTLDVAGSTADGIRSGLSDDLGAFFQTVTPTGAGMLSLLTTVCLFAVEVPYLDVCGSNLTTRMPLAPLRWDFVDDLEGWAPIGNAIRRDAGGRGVARLDQGGAIERAVAVPAGATIFEMEFSPHDRPSSTTQFSVRVTGPQSAATILNVTRTGPATSGFSWSRVTGSLASFAGQTVIIRITQVPQSHGQLYIDWIEIR
ncbi:MAG: Ig-like domain-containing protein [Gemmatimonadales bacterium]